MVRFASFRARRRISRRALVRRCCLPLAAAAAAACHSSTGLTPATSGTLLTTVQQPPGTKAMATVAGPNEYAIFVTGVDTLTLLTPGTYTMSGATATASDPIVTPFYAGTITDSVVVLNAADTARMSASFAVLPGTGRAWVGSTNGSSPIASGLTSTELTTGSAAGTTLSVRGAYEVLDVNSNLWVADSTGNTVSEYPAASLGASGTPTAAVQITSAALSGPIGLVFDRSGDLWISNSGNNTVIEFSASQLATGGSVTPAVTLSGGAISGPGRIAFDPYGNLWVPNNSSNTVVEFSTGQLTTSGAPTPAVTLSATGTSLDGPRGAAFDQQGNLWVANATGNTVVDYGNSQQTASGSPTPNEILSVPSATGGPVAMAFDNTGDIWIVVTASPTIIEYTSQQISTGAASQPTFSIQVPSKPVSLVFNPPPNGIPLVGPQTDRHMSGPTSAERTGSRIVRER